MVQCKVLFTLHFRECCDSLKTQTLNLSVQRSFSFFLSFILSLIYASAIVVVSSSYPFLFQNFHPRHLIFLSSMLHNFSFCIPITIEAPINIRRMISTIIRPHLTNIILNSRIEFGVRKEKENNSSLFLRAAVAAEVACCSCACSCSVVASCCLSAWFLLLSAFMVPLILNDTSSAFEWLRAYMKYTPSLSMWWICKYGRCRMKKQQFKNYSSILISL